MALDPVPTYPGNYDASEANNNPPGSDSRREGDDQIRRMKASEKATWANVTGAVTSTHQQLNALNDYVTASGTVESRLTAVEQELPVGTRIAVYMASAPSARWSQVTSADVDNAMLRVVNTAGGGNGGSDSPILNDKVPIHTHTATSSPAGRHRHNNYENTNTGGGDAAYRFNIGSFTSRDPQGDAFGAARDGSMSFEPDHDHVITVQNNAGGANWTPKYVDMMIIERI